MGPSVCAPDLRVHFYLFSQCALSLESTAHQNTMIDARYFQRGKDPARDLWVVSYSKGGVGPSLCVPDLRAHIYLFFSVRTSH